MSTNNTVVTTESGEAKPRRFVGIRSRVKMTKDGKPRPTQVAIRRNGSLFKMDLENEQAELDFVLGVCPTGYHAPNQTEDISKFREHHVIRDKDSTIVKQVPSGYEGLKHGDTVAMILGGSGDCMAFALSRVATEKNARVMRIPPFVLKNERGNDPEEDDAVLLGKLVETKPQLFYEVYPRDRDLILMRERLRLRIDTMKARIACEQRLRQRFIGAIFCTEEGKFPEGSIEKRFEEQKANNNILNALLAEEKTSNKELAKALDPLEVWAKILVDVEGCGPAIASRLISSIQDIRRFETPAKLQAFCGVHVLKDGRFPRRRNGEVANWHPDSRQALYLLADQFCRRKDTKWGEYLILTKKRLREKHPEVIVIAGKKRYNDGHIHNMAKWRTLSRFVKWLWQEWWKLEKARAELEKLPKVA